MNPVPAPQPVRSSPRGGAFPLVAAVGLFLLGVHTAVGGGLSAPAQMLNSLDLSAALMQAWPYLVLALGLFGSRRWARDLAAPAASLALVRALAIFPRYGFLIWGSWAGGTGLQAWRTWTIIRHSMGNQAAFAALCAITLYVLVQPELVKKCQADRKQAAWTDGLSFAALLLLAYQVFAASAALVVAVQGFNLQALGMALLALLALNGLYLRRIWGWLALLAQSLILLVQSIQTSFSTTLKALDVIQRRFPHAATPFALEAFFRNLPELAVLIFVLGALLTSRRYFQR